jgi:UDP-glucose 4-epimerase
MEVVIVGGCGFVGSYLAKYFAEKGVKVKTIDLKEQSKELLDLGINHETCDIINFEDLERKIGNPDILINTAIIQIPAINEKIELAYNVNIRTTQKLCELVHKSDKIKGMILTGSWHVIGEVDIKGIIDETYGLRPDKVDERSRLYTLNKIAQESVMRIYDAFSDKVFAVIRLSTVLGEGMPEKTAANVFINQALKGEDLTPYKSNMFRPMIYVSIDDSVKAIYNLAELIFDESSIVHNNFVNVFNIGYPKAMNVLVLAESILEIIKRNIGTKSKIKIVDDGKSINNSPEEKDQFYFDVSKAQKYLGIKEFESPYAILEKIIKGRISQ